ncbi:MAG: hypothetical protein JNG86_03835, partial [Verrucomicrobiaceae bacterium]|nr:hypothetical protein [Verrucomicrobiaceae bacterium]
RSVGIRWADTVESCDVKSVTSSLYAQGINARSVSGCHVRYISGLSGTTTVGIGGINVSHCVVETISILGTGISAQQVTNNTITEVGTGIFLGGHGLAKDNTIRANEYGIRTDPGSRIISNTIEGNSMSTGTGIYYANLSNSMLIEDNHVAYWQTGINSSTGLVRRNNVGGCTTPYTISAGMVVVPITALGTNPNANVSF